MSGSGYLHVLDGLIPNSPEKASRCALRDFPRPVVLEDESVEARIRKFANLQEPFAESGSRSEIRSAFPVASEEE